MKYDGIVILSSPLFAAERRLFTPVSSTAVAVPTIFAFPNEYTVGITSLGYQVIWAMLAQRADLQVSRLFTDIHEPLPSESELLGFSVSWELVDSKFHTHARIEVDSKSASLWLCHGTL